MAEKTAGYWQGWKNEPTRIVAWAAAVLQAVVAFGLLDLTRDQIELVLTIIGLTVAGGEVTRTKVTPTRKVAGEHRDPEIQRGL